LYAIFIMPRSGSTWLTELAANTNRLGTPHEWFNEHWIYTDKLSLGYRPPLVRGISDVNKYVESIVEEGAGVAGIELSISQTMMVPDLLDEAFDPKLFSATFYLRRRDVIAQAISSYRAGTSGRWHSYQSSPEQMRSFNSVQYDLDALVYTVKVLLETESKFLNIFHDCAISPISLFYEDLQADPLSALREMAVAIGISPPDTIPETTLTIMRDETSRVWCDRLNSELPMDLAELVEARRLDDMGLNP
jgi:LPS sulfotransferase NodH